MLVRLFGSLATLLRALTGIAFAVLIAAVLLQVVTRLALPVSPVWTEELSRFALLYLVALGGGLALRTGELVNVDLLLTALPERGRRWLEAVAMVGVICFAATLVPPALEFVAIGEFQTSPALGWQMTWIHLIVLIAPLSLALFAIERLVTLALGRGGT
ncbi:MAG TPA: TRAP transporter small permease [Alphaproteobacteria bacterium]